MRGNLAQNLINKFARDSDNCMKFTAAERVRIEYLVLQLISSMDAENTANIHLNIAQSNSRVLRNELAKIDELLQFF